MYLPFLLSTKYITLYAGFLSRLRWYETCFGLLLFADDYVCVEVLSPSQPNNGFMYM